MGGIRSEIFRCVLLTLVAVAAYWPTLSAGFVDFDDPVYVTANRFVSAGLTLDSIRYAWTTFDSGNWIPLTWLSYELDASLFGVSASAFHFTNLLLHIANVLLVYALLRRLTEAVEQSAVVAAWFAVHPLHVESVAWISERKDVLSTFWLLLTLLAYVNYVRWQTWGRYLMVCCGMMLGLLSKSMLVTLPVLLLVLDYWPLQRYAGREWLWEQPENDSRRPWQTLVWEKLPLFGLSLIDGVVTLCAQGAGRSAYTGLEQLPLADRVGNAIHAYAWYLWKTILPVGLSPFYPHPLESLAWWRVAGAATLLLAVSGVVFVYGRQRGHLIFGWLWFLVVLLPVIGLVQVGMQAHADRYSYVAHIGLFTAMVWESADWLVRRTVSRRMCVLLTTATVLILAVLTNVQARHWRNSEALWSHALAVDRDNHLAHYQLGVLHLSEQRLESALDHFRSVLIQRPGHVDALNNLGWIHQLRGERDEAERCYLLAIRSAPEQKRARNNLNRLRQIDRPDKNVTRPQQ